MYGDDNVCINCKNANFKKAAELNMRGYSICAIDTDAGQYYSNNYVCDKRNGFTKEAPDKIQKRIDFVKKLKES